MVHPKASQTSLIWALYQVNNAKTTKTYRFIYQVISPWEKGEELRREGLGKEIGLEPRMEHTMRQVDSSFRVGGA